MMSKETINVGFHAIDSIDDVLLHYAVICSFYRNKIVCVRHRERKSWEIPGGRREKGEDIETTAKRELFEETGANIFTLFPVCEYHVKKDEILSYGRIYKANIQEFSELPKSEIAEIDFFDQLPEHLTYPQIQPKLLEYVIKTE